MVREGGKKYKILVRRQGRQKRASGCESSKYYQGLDLIKRERRRESWRKRESERGRVSVREGERGREEEEEDTGINVYGRTDCLLLL